MFEQDLQTVEGCQVKAFGFSALTANAVNWEATCCDAMSERTQQVSERFQGEGGGDVSAPLRDHPIVDPSPSI
jgi:hypothetical protein